MKRCKKCKVPLEGPLSKLLRTVLRVYPSQKDPSLCNRCADGTKNKSYVCQLCNRTIDERLALTHIKAEEYLLALIKKDHPEWKEEKETCRKCVDYYRDLIKKAQI